MLSRIATRLPLAARTPWQKSSAAVLQQRFAHPINLNMVDSDYNAPASEKTLYRNQFTNKPHAEHIEDVKNATRLPETSDVTKLSSSYAGDPHNQYGMADWRYVHYDIAREPTHPRKPNLEAGELAAGANLIRTDVWHDPAEPAIKSIAKYSPENWRPVGFAENAPNPVTTCPEGTYTFKQNRLPTDHADRRPWLYFVSATTGFVLGSVVRTVVCKLVHTMWPSKDVFAAGIVEVDLRPIEEAQNFVVKWRNKPVFIRRRTPEMIEAAAADDAIAVSMRDPATDADRVQKTEWLIVIGVCTHLGCIPYPDQGNYGAYFCPCHGSHYDHAGRIRQGPAPANLEIPPYSFLDEFTVKLG